MRAPLLSLKHAIPAINAGLEQISIDVSRPMRMVPDGDYTLSLWKDYSLIGIVGISYGLERYYRDIDDFVEGDLMGLYETAIKAAKGKWIVTQVQAAKGTKDLREQYPFRRILMNAWDNIMRSKGESIELFLSADLNYYCIPKVQEDSIMQEVGLPSMSCLRVNYDYLARRRGFVLDQETMLYCRN